MTKKILIQRCQDTLREEIICFVIYLLQISMMESEETTAPSESNYISNSCNTRIAFENVHIYKYYKVYNLLDISYPSCL